MDYMTIEIAEFVKRYSIQRVGTDKIGTRSEATKDDNFVVALKARKPEILAYFDAEEKRIAERKAKIAAIDGLREIEDAISDNASWRREMMRNIDRGDSGRGLRPNPNHDVDALKAKYPRAAAFLKAREMSGAYNYAKAAAGQKALDRIIDGEDWELALSDAEAEWSAYCNKNIFD